MRTILRTITACLLCACLLGTGAVAETATLTGTGSGNNGEITVQVTLTDGAISDVQVLSHSETLASAIRRSSRFRRRLLQRTAPMWISYPARQILPGGSSRR